MPDLILPTTRLHAAFLQCRDDWGPGTHEDGFGLGVDDDVDSSDGFAAWVDRRVRLTHQPEEACPDGAHGTPRWIVEDGQVLGAIALRHTFNDVTGHIGYGVRPSARRRGLATWALGEILGEASALGMARVLIVCDADNEASAHTIEHHGGALEAIRDTDHGRQKRYRITVRA